MLTDCLQKALDTEGITLDEFRELAIRLLNYGVLSAESQTEQQPCRMR